MRRGVVVFAHNTPEVDYYQMAAYTAARVNRFLDLPVTVITDSVSISYTGYTFDNTIIMSPDTSNTRKKSVWINKGRYNVYELTPYDDTLVLDTDYMVNSSSLSQAFSYPGDFCCHRNTSWLGNIGDTGQEELNPSTVQSLWATVIRFQKSSRVEQIFGMIKMIQENYEHYANVYKFLPYMYRNDYALTIALKTVNGHCSVPSDYLHWNLLHVSQDIKIYRETDTAYLIMIPGPDSQKPQYIKISDLDFHMLDKNNFLELME